MASPDTRAGRDEKAFTGPGGNPAGLISLQHCSDAGIHDPGTWAKVQDIDVGDLMLLGGFYERDQPHRGLPVDLNSHHGAAIIKALEFHTGMNYMADHGGEVAKAMATEISRPVAHASYEVEGITDPNH